jgi:hypothetical protein
MNKTARHERRKLTASYLNTVGAAVLVVGGLAPLASIVYGNGPNPINSVTLTVGSTICIVVSLALRWLARSLLEGIEE